MDTADKLAIIRDKLVWLASELRGLKCSDDLPEGVSDLLEAAEDDVDNAELHIITALDEVKYAAEGR